MQPGAAPAGARPDTPPARSSSPRSPRAPAGAPQQPAGTGNGAGAAVQHADGCGQAGAGTAPRAAVAASNGVAMAAGAQAPLPQQQPQPQPQGHHMRSATFADGSDLDESSSSSSSLSSSVSPASSEQLQAHQQLQQLQQPPQQQRLGQTNDPQSQAQPAVQQQPQQQQEPGSLPQHLHPPGGQQRQGACSSCSSPANGSLGEHADAAGPAAAAAAAAAAPAAAAAAVGAGAAGGAQHCGADGSGGSSARGRSSVTSVDPDYEVPQGRLTETQVLLAHGTKLQLDRYGFIVNEPDAAARAGGGGAGGGGGASSGAVKRQRSTAQVRREQRHVAKWRRMLGSGPADFGSYAAAKPAKVKRRVRKGIPDEFRGLVWQYLSGGHALMTGRPGAYDRLLGHAPDSVDHEIMRDLNRTFPNHVFFHQRQGPGQQSLFHVLRAYSAFDKQVGYVQGMGFVAAILLMYMDEEAAFWTLVALLKGTAAHPPLEGLYQAGMPLLQQCLFQFQELLKQEHPRLGGHMEQEGVVPSMYCTHWFNTLFAYSLPFEHLLRVWDVFLLEGMKVVFRVGVVLLASAQDALCGMPFERLVAALNGRKFPVLAKHPDVLMRAALRIPVSRRLEQLRERYQVLQAEAAAAAAASAAAAAPAAGAGAGRSGGRSGGAGSSSGPAPSHEQLVAGLAPLAMGPPS